MDQDVAFSHKIDYFTIFTEIQSLEGHLNCITGYGDFAEKVDFAYWRSFSGGGSAINGATPSSFYVALYKH